MQEDFGSEDEEYGSTSLPNKNALRKERTQALTIFNADSNGKDLTDEEEEAQETSLSSKAVQRKALDDERDMQQLFYQTESDRKKERRKERAWRVKDGDKRRKEGLPRNFLLVDEYTKKPYGVGVGD